MKLTLESACNGSEGRNNSGATEQESQPAFFSSWLCCMACEILVPRPGTEPGPSAVRVQSPNHWAARESLSVTFF